MLFFERLSETYDANEIAPPKAKSFLALISIICNARPKSKHRIETFTSAGTSAGDRVVVRRSHLLMLFHRAVNCASLWR